jgi:hypothetical protein
VANGAIKAFIIALTAEKYLFIPEHGEPLYAEAVSF